jgi:tetratricopeptide (TPR) repeat protein
MVRVWALCSVVLLALLCSARPSRADEAADKAAAEALYQLGRRLTAEGKYTEACPKFAASHELDPGVGTLLLLGDCQEQIGKVASAWATFQEAAALARTRNDTERAGVAELRAAALGPRLSYVTFKVAQANAMNGFELRRGGIIVPKASWDVKLPMDPGVYDLAASAPGYETWRWTLDVPAELDAPLVVAIPALHEAAPRPLLPAIVPLQQSPAAVEPAAPAQPARGSGQRTLGVVTASAGAATLIAAGVLTWLAAARNEDSKEHCRATNSNL